MGSRHPPEGRRAVRGRWETFQAVRSWLLLAGFVLGLWPSLEPLDDAAEGIEGHLWA